MIEKDERLPLYYQLMDTILGQIENGEYKEHEKLPSERDLCDRFNISRTTVRQTMKELEKEGYIYRKHGKGSFVSSKMFNQSLVQFYSFTEETIKMGKIPASKVLSFERILSDNKIAKKLNVQFEEEVYKIVRLRLANDEPMLYEVTYLPVSRFENLSRKELESTPMYDTRLILLGLQKASKQSLPEKMKLRILTFKKEVPACCSRVQLMNIAILLSIQSP
jgi:GntR family transcriptional regulator